MKNVHVLPTPKPSRLIYNDVNQLCYQSNKSAKNDRKWTYRKRFNLYITSDEEIKEGDWFLTPVNDLEWANKEWLSTIAQFIPKSNFKKIIITTDQDLIKDGVQAIDDDFLEWFVKNPSCEHIDVKSWILTYEDGSTFDRMDYKIIIPKEEPKPFKNMLPMTEASLAEFKKNPVPMKKETLEEAAERLVKETTLYGNKNSPIGTSDRSYFETELRCVLLGMKYQQERSYSCGELNALINLLKSTTEYEVLQSFRDKVEQFKKK